jgi:hypothetical protein
MTDELFGHSAIELILRNPGKRVAAQLSTNRSLCQRKTEGGLENELVNLPSRKRITKKAHAGRGPEMKW